MYCTYTLRFHDFGLLFSHSTPLRLAIMLDGFFQDNEICQKSHIELYALKIDQKGGGLLPKKENPVLTNSRLIVFLIKFWRKLCLIY